MSLGSVRSCINDVVNELKNRCAGVAIIRLQDGSVSFVTDTISAIRLIDSVDNDDSIIRSIIVNACNSCESLHPNSTELLVSIIQNMLHIRSDYSRDEIRAVTNDMINQLSTVTDPITQDMIDRCVSDIIPDVSDIVLSAVKLAGSECKIFVEPSTNDQTCIELLRGHTFKCVPDVTISGDKKWIASNVKCFVVDGVVESVSEIDSLLQECHRQKQPLIIFARGFSKDVITTLRVNYARKTLNVMPVCVEFDLETVNVLIDVAMCCGCDVVSSLKGELISTVKFEDLPVIRSAVCSGRSATIDSEMNDQIKNHLKTLINKREFERIETMRGILDMRIRSLSSSAVIIRANNRGPQGNKLLSDIDVGLRLVKDLIRLGVTRRDDLFQIDSRLNIFGGALKYELYPASMIKAVLRYALDTIILLDSSDVIVRM